jgi:hypothetical protein
LSPGIRPRLSTASSLEGSSPEEASEAKASTWRTHSWSWSYF